MQDEELTERMIGCAMKVHRTLGPGYLESVYENALAYEFGKAGLAFERQAPIRVFYEGVTIGDFIADMIVEKRIIVELKAIQTLNQAHEVQLVNYLTAIRIDVGLLLNFGAPSLQFKRKHRTYRPSQG
jgi:GxxExxY protein